VSVSPSQFVANYPEFADALSQQPALIQNVLDEAYLLTPDSVWPAWLVDQAAQLRAAQALALSPFGRALQLTEKDGGTVYDARLERIARLVGAGGSLV
jgi:hypothetical protein